MKLLLFRRFNRELCVSGNEMLQSNQSITLSQIYNNFSFVDILMYEDLENKISDKMKSSRREINKENRDASKYQDSTYLLFGEEIILTSDANEPRIVEHTTREINGTKGEKTKKFIHRKFSCFGDQRSRYIFSLVSSTLPVEVEA